MLDTKKRTIQDNVFAAMFQTWSAQDDQVNVRQLMQECHMRADSILAFLKDEPNGREEELSFGSAVHAAQGYLLAAQCLMDYLPADAAVTDKTPSETGPALA